MNTVIFQILTILFLAIILIFLAFLLKRGGTMTEKAGRDIWLIKCKRISPSTCGFLRSMLFSRKGKAEITLTEGSFYLGNHMLRDDIVLQTGAAIRLYLNVTAEKIFVTVLKGSVQVGGHTYNPDDSMQIVIRDYMEILHNDQKLIFRKMKGGW